MTEKSYKIPENKPETVCEPVTAYQRRPATAEMTSSDKWNPNIPLQVTEEEWLEHIRKIEEGPFMSIEEADREFEIWKKEFLASRML